MSVSRCFFFRLVCVSALVVELLIGIPLPVHAFVRLYQNYDVVSENGRFIAEVDYGLKAGDPRVRVSEIKGDSRESLWEAKLFLPISETIHLSNDGSAIVLENYYPYTDEFLYFFYKGNLVRRYKAQELCPAHQETEKDRSIGGPIFGEGQERRAVGEFSFLSTFNGKPCYCVWYSGQTNWVSWTLEDAQRVTAGPQQQVAWDEEARRLAEKCVQRRSPPSPSLASHGQVPQGVKKSISRPQLPSAEACLKFLTRDHSVESRKRIEALLSDQEYHMQWYGPDEDIVGFGGGSEPRARGDRLLADFDGKRETTPSGQLRPGRRHYLGAVKGVVELPHPPTNGVLTIALVPASLGAGWPERLPPEHLTAEFEEVAETMKRILDQRTFKMPSRFAFKFGEVLPGEYRVKVLWKMNLNADPGPEHSATLKPEAGDLYGETALTSVSAGLMAEPGVFQCDVQAVR